MNRKLIFILNNIVSFIVGVLASLTANRLDPLLKEGKFSFLINIKFPLISIIVFIVTFIITFLVFFLLITRRFSSRLTKKQKEFLKKNNLEDTDNKNIEIKWNAYFDDFNRPKILDLEIKCKKNSSYGVPLKKTYCPRSTNCSKKSCAYKYFDYYQIKANIESILDAEWQNIQNKNYQRQLLFYAILRFIIFIILLFSNIFLCTKVLTQRNKNNKLKVEYEKVLSDLNDTQTELRNTKIELDNKNTINTEKEE